MPAIVRRQEFSVGLVSPADPVLTSRRKQAGVQGFANADFSHLEFDVIDILCGTGELANGLVFFRDITVVRTVESQEVV